MSASLELEVALEVERRLASLLIGSPGLSELPIAPLRGVSDLVRLEIHQPVYRSKVFRSTIYQRGTQV
jgi:hypothetical protein